MGLADWAGLGWFWLGDRLGDEVALRQGHHPWKSSGSGSTCSGASQVQTARNYLVLSPPECHGSFRDMSSVCDDGMFPSSPRPIRYSRIHAQFSWNM